jgi:PPOX class probable F420-dependent enzyme
MTADGWTAVAPYCRAPQVGFLGTTAPGGGPHVVPSWLDTEGDLIRVNSTEGTAKLRNMRSDPRVALSIHVSSTPFLAFTVFARVENEEKGEAAVEHIDDLSRAYDGEPWVFHPGEAERRVMLRLRPERVALMSEDGGT